MTVNHLSTSALYTPRFEVVQFRTHQQVNWT